MKKKIALLVLSFVILTPYPVSADFGYPAVMQIATHNFRMTGMDYNQTEHILRLEMESFEDSWYNIGLAALEVKFNISHPPEIEYLSVTLDNETLDKPIDMLKNYTLVDGTFNSSSGEIVECKYILIYFYLFTNKTIINEHPMPGFIGPEWNHTDDITVPTKPFQMSSNSKSSQKNSINAVIPTRGYEPENENTVIVVAVLILSVVAVIVVLYHIWKQRR